MSGPQTTVAAHPDYGMPGQLATLRSAADAKVDTYLNEEASAAIPFGSVVKAGTLENRAKIPSAQADLLVGIACFGHSFARSFQAGQGEISSLGILPGTHFGVVREGVVWVMPEDDVTPGLEVHVRVTANGPKVPGNIGTGEDTTKTVDITAFAQWETAGGPTSGQPAKVWVNFLNASMTLLDS